MSRESALLISHLLCIHIGGKGMLSHTPSLSTQFPWHKVTSYIGRQAPSQCAGPTVYMYIYWSVSMTWTRTVTLENRVLRQWQFSLNFEIISANSLWSVFIYSNTYSACTAIEQVAIYFLDLWSPKMWPTLHFFLLRAKRYAECVDKIGSAAFCTVPIDERCVYFCFVFRRSDMLIFPFRMTYLYV